MLLAKCKASLHDFNARWTLERAPGLLITGRSHIRQSIIHPSAIAAYSDFIFNYLSSNESFIPTYAYIIIR
jgi:hypothetical protein